MLKMTAKILEEFKGMSYLILNTYWMSRRDMETSHTILVLSQVFKDTWERTL